MTGESIEVEVFAPGFACDGTRVMVPDFAQVLTLATFPAQARVATHEGALGALVPQLLVRFGPTGRYHDSFEVWEEIGREVVA